MSHNRYVLMVLALVTIAVVLGMILWRAGVPLSPDAVAPQATTEGSDAATPEGVSAPPASQAPASAAVPSTPPDSPGHFAGQLFSDTGKPLADMPVQIIQLEAASPTDPAGNGAAYAVESGPDGRFTTALPFGVFKAIVETETLFAEHRFELSAARPSEYWTQVVGTAGWISGRVLDAQGNGRAGVLVVAMRDRSDYAFEKLRIASDGATVSGENGAYRLRVPVSSAHLWQIAAVVREVVATLSPSVAPGMDKVNLHLPDDGTIQGQVLDLGTEEAVPGLTLRLESRPFYVASVEVTTDEDGRFALEGLPQGRYVIAPADTSVLLAGDTDVNTWGEAEVDLALYTSSGSTVEGRVSNTAGEAMAGVEVRLTRNRETWSGESREDGIYRVTGLSSGQHALAVWTENGLLTNLSPVVFGDQPEVLQKDIVIDCHAVHGRVLLPDGTGVAGAEVVVSGDNTVLWAVSGDDGTFDLACVTGGAFTLSAKAEGRQSGQRGPFSPTDAAGDGIDLVLDFALDGFVAGRVVDGSGRPLAFAKVTLSPVSDQAGTLYVSTNTDGNGLFAMVAGTPETYELRVSPQWPGFGELVVKGCSELVTLGPGERRTGLRVTCDYPQGLIEGTVVDSAGRPIGGATVNVLGTNSAGTAATRSDGAFGIAGLEKLPHIVVVQHPDFARGMQEGITPDARDVRFTLQGRPLLRVVAVDAQDSTPVERFSVVLLSVQAHPLFGPTGTASPDGVLEARVDAELMGGQLTLRVESEGYVDYQEEVRLDPAAPEQEFRVALVKAAHILRGRVQDLSGAPLPGAGIYLDALPRNPAATVVQDGQPGGSFGAPGGRFSVAQPAPEPEATTDSEGRFQLSMLDDAPRAVFATLEGYAPVSAVTSASETSAEPLLLEMQPAGAVQVTVLKGGEPLMGARVSLAPDGLRGGTHVNGSLIWNAVTPGIATLEVLESREADAPTETMELEVHAGQVTEVIVQFP